MNRAGNIARAILRALGSTLALMLAVCLVPFWAAGAAFEAVRMAFELGRNSFRNLDKKLEQP